MSMHEHVLQTIRAIVSELDGDVSPTLLANRCYDRYANGDLVEAHIEYGALEHYKQIARSALAREYDPTDDSEPANGDMFSGHLQSRYPIPVKPGEEPIYRPREALTQAHLDWNIQQLRKSAIARMKHADALEAYRDSRSVEAAA